MNKQQRKQIDALLQKIAEAKSKLDGVTGQIEEMRDAEREKYDNMSESLQSGEKGEAIDAAANALDEAATSAQEVDDALENVESKLDEASQS